MTLVTGQQQHDGAVRPKSLKTADPVDKATRGCGDVGTSLICPRKDKKARELG